MQNFDKAAHVGALVSMGKIDIHVYGGNRMLIAVFAVQNRYGIAQVFYTDFINGNVAEVSFVLYIFHFKSAKGTD